MHNRFSLDAEDQDRHVFASDELVRTTLRILAATTGVCYAIFQFAAAGLSPRLLSITFPITSVIVATAFAAFFLPRRSVALAQVAWHAGLLLAITLGLLISQDPSTALLYATIPLMAVIALGGAAGVLMELIIGLILAAGSRVSAFPALPSAYVLATMAVGAWLGILGWVGRYTLLTMTKWALFYYERAREGIEDVRSDCLELEETRQDLIKANQELARLSDRLKAMFQVAEEARRAKEDFVARVSHELRTPLNMIIGFSDMIPKASRAYGLELPPALLSDISAIRRNSEHLAKLVNDVLDLSQVDSGQLALRREQTSIQAVVEEAATAVRALFESKGLDLQLEILPDIPPVLCDTTRIRQVLINLLSNAGRYTESGGVRVATELIGSDVVVRVADTGPGIAQSDIERLFEPFQQIESPLRGQPGGSGLGLSISKRFVEMHGGTLWVESTPGVGSTFSFSLPVTPPASAALVSSQYSRWINPYQHHEPRTHPSRVPPPTTQPRFVFLDHGDAACHYLSHYLDGAEIEHVRAPAEARAALTQSPAGALIVNESAFGQDPEVVELLRQLPYDTPALSCWIPGSDDAARQLGVLRYLVKPIERDALLSTLAVLGEGPHIVLIVDDQPEVLQLFTRMLASSDRQYRILQAKNGQRALDLLRNRRPDIVLLDLIMPVMDGFEVLRQKNADPGIRDIPVIVVSSRDPSGDPVASQSLTVTRSGGLSIRSLANCIQALTSLLAPSPRRADQS